MQNTIQEILMLNSWVKPIPSSKEAFEPTMSLQGLVQSRALNALTSQATSLGIKQAQPNLAPLSSITIPGVKKVVVDASQDPNSKFNQTLASVETNGIEDGAWDVYTSMTSTKDMKGLRMGLLNSFCDCNATNQETLAQQCSTLSEYNCKRVGCCVFTSANKCLAGTETGPSNSVTPIDYYYYKNKCYGQKCPPSTCK